MHTVAIYIIIFVSSRAIVGAMKKMSCKILLACWVCRWRDTRRRILHMIRLFHSMCLVDHSWIAWPKYWWCRLWWFYALAHISRTVPQKFCSRWRRRSEGWGSRWEQSTKNFNISYTSATLIRRQGLQYSKGCSQGSLGPSEYVDALGGHRE